MDVKITKEANSQVKLVIALDEKDLAKYEKVALEEISKNVKIKGFRPGKAPKDMIISHVGKEYFEAYVQEKAIQPSYVKAVVDNKVHVLAAPEVKVLETSPLKFEAMVSVMPEVKLKKDWEKIKVKVEEAKVTKKDVDEFIDSLRNQNTEWYEKKDKAVKGDKVEVNFEGFDLKEGTSLPGTKSENHPVVLGQGMLIPGFEEQIEGMKADEEKDFEIKFPKDYHHNDFKDKKVKFHIKVNKVFKPEVPKLDDAFVEKMLGSKKSVDDLKKEVEDNMKAQKERENRVKAENDFLEKLSVKADVELPEVLVHDEVHNILNQLRIQSHSHDDEHHKKYRPEAQKRIKVRLVLNHVFENYDEFKADEKEVKKEIDNMVKSNKDYKPSQEDEFRIRHRIQIDKLFKKHLDQK